jgi:hypothetical protein
MLPGEQSLPEAIVAPDGQTVNRLFDWLCHRANSWLATEFQAAMRKIQIDWFSQRREALLCPDCGGQRLIRKGWRSRVLATSRGKLAVNVIQVRCKACGRTFRPLNQVLVDSTKVKAGQKERGEPVYLAVTAEPGPLRYGRPTCKKQLVHLHVGTSQKLLRRLKEAGVTHVVHDGGESLEGCVPHLQRCRWHLGYQLKHYLWQDGVPHAFRGQFQETMTQIVSDPVQGPKRFQRWQKHLSALGLKTAAGHLSNAARETFTYIKEPFSYVDTSPLEREMRELNRRADTGARWSPKGLENVLMLLFHHRLNETCEGHR